MINSLHRPPRRPSRWRGAFFGAGLLAGALTLFALNHAIAFLSRFPVAAASRVQIAPLPAPKPRAQGSLAGELAKIDAETVRAYIARWTQTPQNTAPGARRAVRIDAETLARRHPAWQLAGALENGAIEPSNPQIAHVLLSAASVVAEGADASMLAAAPFSTTSRTIAGVVVSANRGSAARTSAARTAQSRALDLLLAQSVARDATRARDVALLSRRALDDTVARAARGTVSPSQVPLLAPDLALELLNLRLQLLRNLARTPQQRAASRQQIRAIEARYNALLQREAAAQAASLRAATLEIPAQIRREGLLQIERDAGNAARQNAQIRAALAQQTRAQIRRDFAPESALQLALPPLRALPPLALPPFALPNSAASPLIAADSSGAAPQFFETARQIDASKAPLAAKGEFSSRSRAQIAALLRRKARLDAALWSRSYAAHLGATWRQNAATASSKAPAPDVTTPDLTAAALQTIFPTTRR